MNATPPSDHPAATDGEPETDSTAVPAPPEATVAGDWTVLAAVAAVVVGLLFWRRWRRQS
ncbi:MAG TPA: hypothetical protein VFB84_22440 [Micromonosporaceae bacterium]|nr:hypothetical protein [Micromonosporaceae bacterium]